MSANLLDRLATVLQQKIVHSTTFLKVYSAKNDDVVSKHQVGHRFCMTRYIGSMKHTVSNLSMDKARDSFRSQNKKKQGKKVPCLKPR